jgi:cellobiose-specific phosphotransferase system component IIC
MKEMSLAETNMVNGGGTFVKIIYCVIGVGLYKILSSKKGRICIPKVITYEWNRS